jgi:hemerythrin-like domain-containing protein
MMYENRVCQKLHDEHMATLALLERLERFAAGAPAVAGDPAARTLLVDLAVAFENEIRRHFAFEEAHLFGYFAETGDAEMAQHLTEEHVQIRDLGERVVAMARGAATAGFAPAAWNEFRPVARLFADQLAAHANKEEGVLIPLLQDSMDGDTEERLFTAYVLNEESF